jgi:RimJ/RimL family protein N-acetyltransferase
MIMETERLMIRTFSEEDWRDLHEYLSQEQVLKYEPGEVSDEEDCRKMARERAQGDRFWAVCLKESDKRSGIFILSKRNLHHSRHGCSVTSLIRLFTETAMLRRLVNGS